MVCAESPVKDAAVPIEYVAPTRTLWLQRLSIVKDSRITLPLNRRRTYENIDRTLTKLRHTVHHLYNGAVRHRQGTDPMNISKWIATASIAAAVASQAMAAPMKASERDIVDTAVSAKNFTTLVAAIKAADLVSTLKGTGPFTVFAPTDAAFRKLEKSKPGTIAFLLKPENKEKLAAILTYHVVSGKVMASDVMKLADGTEVKTVNGQSLTIHNKHGVKVNNAKVIKADIVCSNGVIHVIDTVLIPN